MGSVGIFGIGNVLFGDDGFGATVIEYLNALWEFPEGVVLEDLGTPSLALPTWLTEHESVIFLDAVADEHPPGTVLLYDREAIGDGAATVRISPHEPTLQETIATLDFSGVGPKDVILIGVVPKSTEECTSLTPEVRAVLPKVLDAVISELAKRGYVATPRQGAAAPRLWWEVAVA